MLTPANEIWVQGDDGQLVELTNIMRFDTITEPGLALNTISAYVEFKSVEIEYVKSLPIKKDSTTNIRNRKLR